MSLPGLGAPLSSALSASETVATPQQRDQKAPEQYVGPVADGGPQRGPPASWRGVASTARLISATGLRPRAHWGLCQSASSAAFLCCRRFCLRFLFCARCLSMVEDDFHFNPCVSRSSCVDIWRPAVLGAIPEPGLGLEPKRALRRINLWLCFGFRAGLSGSSRDCYFG